MVRLGKREGLVGVGQICQKCVQAFSTGLMVDPEVKTISVTYASVFKDLNKGSPKARWWWYRTEDRRAPIQLTPVTRLRRTTTFPQFTWTKTDQIQ